MNGQNRTLILHAGEIQKKLERIAWEIYEKNSEEKEILFIGVKSRGSILATKLKTLVEDISSLKISQCELSMNKANPLSEEVKFLPDPGDLSNRCIILIDDVANTGRTHLYALKPLLAHLPSRVQIAVLIDRRHKEFPISPDYIGLSLSTSLHEQIRVDLSDGNFAVYLE